MHLFIEKKELPLFINYFGNYVTIVSKGFCDITKTDRLNIKINKDLTLEDAFYLGRIFELDKFVNTLNLN